MAAGQNHAVCYENVSHLAGPMQDTGDSEHRRQVRQTPAFTDSEEHVISVRRPW